MTFNGNEAISSSKLQEQMELQPDSWWKLWGNKFDGSQFDKDIQAIQDYYQNNGYAKARVTKTDVQLNEEHTKADPHAWLDLSNGIKYVEEIARIFSEKDAENATLYKKNAEAYVEKLKELDTQAKESFASIEENKKLLVTSEGAFKYFSRAYDLPAAYIWEINTESQGTPDQMKAIIDQIRAKEVPVLFVETSVDSRSMERVAKETGLKIYDKLFTDSIAKEGEQGDSYYQMMKWNIETIHEGLSQTKES